MIPVSGTVISVIKLVISIFIALGIIKVLLKILDRRLEKQILKELTERQNSNLQMIFSFSPDREHTCHVITRLGPSKLLQRQGSAQAHPPTVHISKDTNTTRLPVQQVVIRRITKHPDGKVVLEEERRMIPLPLQPPFRSEDF